MTSCSDVLVRIRKHCDSYVRDLQTFNRQPRVTAQDRGVRECVDWLAGIATIARLFEEVARPGEGSGWTG
jgi:hypothetical protein